MIGEEVCWVILHMYYDLDLDAEAISWLVWTPKHKISAKYVERIVERFENSGEVRTIHQRRDLRRDVVFASGRSAEATIGDLLRSHDRRCHRRRRRRLHFPPAGAKIRLPPSRGPTTSLARTTFEDRCAARARHAK